MATERNGDTIIKVYTSSIPQDESPDEAQYVRRAGRAQARCVPVGRVAQLKAALRRVRRGGAAARPQTDPAAAPQVDGPGDTKVWVRPRARHEAERTASGATDARGRRPRALRRPGVRRGSGGRRALSGRMAREALAVCAALMCVVSIKALPFGWAQQATAVMSSAVNMSVDLDKTLGQLQFVREVMPASAMVFFGGGSGYSAPFEGEVTHPFSDEQPWLEYMGDSQAVNCVRAGMVSQLEQGAAGDWAVRVDHGDGLESIYAFLSAVSVREGDSVAGAQQLGRADGQSGARIYFEMRLNGEPVDPAAYLGES